MAVHNNKRGVRSLWLLKLFNRFSAGWETIVNYL